MPDAKVRVGSWAELHHAAWEVRDAVFVQEQGIAVENERDAADRGAVHAVAFNVLAQPVATGRLLIDASGQVAQIGRVAVRRSLRGTGLGAAIMQALEAAAYQRGVQKVQLHAQLYVAGFYQRLGYAAYGAPFDEVGIAHISMDKRLHG